MDEVEPVGFSDEEPTGDQSTGTIAGLFWLAVVLAGIKFGPTLGATLGLALFGA